MGRRLADGIASIKNALMAKHNYVDIKSNSLVLSVCEILKEEGYVKDVKKLENIGNKNVIRVVLKYVDESKKQPVIRDINLISKPSRRVHIKADDIKPVMNGLGIGIISTSKGVITTEKAKELGVGGEYICEVF